MKVETRVMFNPNVLFIFKEPALMPVETTVLYKPSVAEPELEKCSQVNFLLLTFKSNATLPPRKFISGVGGFLQTLKY